MQSADAYVIEALKSGATGYVLKETGPSELVNAVREVIQGNQYLSAKLSERLQADGRRIIDTPSDPYETLKPSTSVKEILQMTAEGPKPAGRSGTNSISALAQLSCTAVKSQANWG